LDRALTNIPAVCTAAGLGATQNLEGKPATFAPKWSGRVGFDWTGDFWSSGYSWDLNSNLSFISKQFGGLQNDANPQSLADGYTLLGGRLTLNGPDQSLGSARFCYRSLELISRLVADDPLATRRECLPNSLVGARKIRKQFHVFILKTFGRT
jgi:hypothetical protein